MKVYCDNGACPGELKELQKLGAVELLMFPYENKNKHIRSTGLPSNCGWKDLSNLTWKTLPGAWNDYCGSDKYLKIVEILMLANKRVDILHLDSAYKSSCQVFITNDKDDIWANRLELQTLLGMKIFSVFEIQECLEFILQSKQNA